MSGACTMRCWTAWLGSVGKPSRSTRQAIGWAATRLVARRYDAAKQAAQRYLAAHGDAGHVRIYVDATDGETWDLTRAEVLS